MQLHWTTGMRAYLYDPKANDILEGKVTALYGIGIGHRMATLSISNDGKDVMVHESELYQEWEQAWIENQEAIKDKSTAVKNLQAITNMIESILYDPSTKMTDLNRNLMRTAVDQLKDASCLGYRPKRNASDGPAALDETERDGPAKYVACLAGHAVRDVQYDTGYMSDRLDDCAWTDCPDARVFLGLFNADTEAQARELAAQFADTDPRNVEVLPIGTDA